MTTTAFTNGVTLTDAGWFNDTDTVTYAGLTAVAGTNTITATGPASFSAYATRQRFIFIPAATNTAAATLNIGGVGAKNVFWNGAACSGGEMIIGVPVIVVYDGTQFNIVGPMIGSRLTNVLGGDVALNNTANYFDGPSVAQGTVGTWFAWGSVSLTDTAGGANFNIKLWDGTSVISSARASINTTNQFTVVSLSGYITSPAANIRISARDVTSTSGVMSFNASGNSKDANIFVVRIQ